MILSIPQFVVLAFLSWKSFQMWDQGFKIKVTERFYRVSFTYYMYTAFIKLVMALLLGLPEWNSNGDGLTDSSKVRLIIQSGYFIQITVSVFVLLPVINKYILQEKKKAKDQTKKNLHEKNLRATNISNLMKRDPTRFTNLSKKDYDLNNRVQLNASVSSNPSFTNILGKQNETARFSNKPLLQQLSEIEEEYKSQ